MRSILLSLAIVSALSLLGCSGKRPADLGVAEGALAPCPSSPNCVSSAATGDHGITGFELSGSAEEAWLAIQEEVAKLPGTEVISKTEAYLHAESTSSLMRYVDDLELHLPAGSNMVAVRSASRVGHSDMGVNRERVEALRGALRARGVLQ